MITLVVTICHMITGISTPFCHDVVVSQVDNMMACTMSQPLVADWKEKSIYQGDQWTVMKVGCVRGTYFHKNET